jgi:hypothetical protein
MYTDTRAARLSPHGPGDTVDAASGSELDPRIDIFFVGVQILAILSEASQAIYRWVPMVL